MAYPLTINCKPLLLTLISSIFMCYCIGQSSDSSLTTTTDSIITKKPSVTFAAIYSTNANYYGQVADEKMSYVALAATVQLPFGLYFTGLGYHLFGDSNWVSASAIGAGYEFHITKKLTADFSYNHSFYPVNSPFIQASNTDIVSGNLVYEHIFSTGATFDYAFGKEASDYFFTLSNYKAFDFYTNHNKAIVSITPQLDITAGTQRFLETYQTKKNNNKGNGKPTVPSGPPQTVTTEYTRFDLLSYNFNLPVSYSRGSYMLELSYQLSLLGNKVVSNPGSTHSFFTASVYYQF
ncbi:MAG: hypothetical protein ACK5NK_11025 [Niabella sp.]